MGAPVVHFEILGADPARLRAFYGELFGWRSQVGDAASAKVSRPGGYGLVRQGTAEIAGGVGGGGFAPRVLFYVGVDDVEAALARAESLGGARRMGPEPRSGGDTCGAAPPGSPDEAGCPVWVRCSRIGCGCGTASAISRAWCSTATTCSSTTWR